MQGQASTEESLGRRIRSLRGDLSQEQFAKRVGLTRSALANYETNRTRPKRSTLSRIAEATGAPLSYLLNGVMRLQDLERIAEKDADHTRLDLFPATRISEDEASLLRLLRLMPLETMKKIGALISQEIADNSGTILGNAPDLFHVGRDFKLAFELKSSGRFQKTLTPRQLEEREIRTSASQPDSGRGESGT